MSGAKSTVVSLKVHEHHKARVERFRALLRRRLRDTPGIPSSIDPSLSDALAALIDGALDLGGAPTFGLRELSEDPDPFASALRRMVRRGDLQKTISFRPDALTLTKLDAFVAWLGARAVLQSRVDRASALRTLMFEALDVTGAPRFDAWGGREGPDVESMLESGELLPLQGLDELYAHDPDTESADALAARLSADALAVASSPTST